MKKAKKTKAKQKVPYMVLVVNRDIPRVVHASFEDACAEAKRLLSKNVGYQVYVLKVEAVFEAKVSACQKAYAFPAQSVEDEEIPF